MKILFEVSGLNIKELCMVTIIAYTAPKFSPPLAMIETGKLQFVPFALSFEDEHAFPEVWTDIIRFYESLKHFFG